MVEEIMICNVGNIARFISGVIVGVILMTSISFLLMVRKEKIIYKRREKKRLYDLEEKVNKLTEQLNAK